MHTIYVVMLGFLLLVVFLLGGHALGHGRQAALYSCRPGWPEPLLTCGLV